MWGLSPHTATLLLGILGNIANFAFFLSSAPVAYRMIKEKSTGDLSATLYVFKLMNCLLWSVYGLPWVHPNYFAVLITNLIGAVVAAIYLSLYLYFGDIKEQIRVICELVILLSGLAIMVLLLIALDDTHRMRIKHVGLLCAIVSSLMHMALLSQMGMFIKTREPQYLRPSSSILAFAKATTWTMYGLVSFDLHIVVANAIGIAIGFIQVILVMVFFVMKLRKLKVSQAKLSPSYFKNESQFDTKLKHGSNLEDNEAHRIYDNLTFKRLFE